MKKLLMTAAAFSLATAAHAADEVKLQLQWVTQAQFAGYYVALDKGFYEEEDLDGLLSILDPPAIFLNFKYSKRIFIVFSLCNTKSS